MTIHSVLITGASRGIGLGLVRQFLGRDDVHIVIAGVRNAVNGDELGGIMDKRLHIIELDVSNDDSISEAFVKVDKIVGPKGLTILINNAAVLPGYDFATPPGRAVINQTLNINCVSPVIMMQMFYPLLKRSAEQQEGDHFSPKRAAIVQISSELGSIALEKKSHYNDRVKVLDYCMSKSALNQATRIIAHDIADDHIIAVALHPGWVGTDMGWIGGVKPDVTVEDCTQDLTNSIVTLKKEHSGGLFDRKLKPIPF